MSEVESRNEKVKKQGECMETISSVPLLTNGCLCLKFIFR